MPRAVDKIRRKKAELYMLAESFAGHMEAHAKQTASWVNRTGHARQSIHSGAEENENEIVAYLSHGVQYGGYLEDGTPPHVIRPKDKKALYWYGADHPVKEVHHPGTKAQPVIGPTVDVFWPRMKKARRNLFREN